MPLLMIYAMTTFAVVLFAWLIASSQHTNLYSLRNLFMAVWLYYGFSVGMDLMTGAEIPYTPGETHMMDPTSWNAVAFVMWNYVLCGVAFITTYFVLQGSKESRPLPLRFDLQTPPAWALIAIHCVSAYVYVQVFFGMDRMERIAMSQLHLSYKFATLVVPLTLAIDVLVVMSSKTKTDHKAIIAIGLAFLLSLLTGNRSYVMFVFLIGAFHWRPALQGWRLLGMVASCAGMVFAFKTLYAVGLAWYMGVRVDARMIYENLHMTLSGLDADASYSIALFYTSHASPLWLGKTYVVTPFMLAWPRFLGGMHVTTLAEDYVWMYHISTAKRGGAMAFSAIAESWLNFSYAGPLIIGVAWGAITNFFDRRPRGIAYLIVLLMVARVFRSDAASLFKNWIMVWGLMFTLALVLMTIYSALVAPVRPAFVRQQPTPTPRLGGNLP